MKVEINIGKLGNTIEQAKILKTAIEDGELLLDEAAGLIPQESFEGRGGDIVRGQLFPGFKGELSDLCATLEKFIQALTDAQTSCFECKNYCDDFPEAVINAVMPSKRTGIPVGEVLMADGGPNEQIRDYCTTAAEKAGVVKKKAGEAQELIGQLKHASVSGSEALGMRRMRHYGKKKTGYNLHHTVHCHSSCIRMDIQNTEREEITA